MRMEHSEVGLVPLEKEPESSRPLSPVGGHSKKTTCNPGMEHSSETELAGTLIQLSELGENKFLLSHSPAYGIFVTAAQVD